MLKKSIAIFGGAIALTWGALQTPYVEPVSEIIKALNGLPDCLKIKTKKPNDLSVSHLGSSTFKSRFFAYQVDGDHSFSGNFSMGSKMFDEEVNSGRNLFLKLHTICDLELVSDTLFKVSRSSSDACMDDFEKKRQDWFLTNDPIRDFYISCGLDTSKHRENGYQANCMYSGQYKGWDWNIFIPSENVQDWDKALAAAQTRFDETLEVLPACPAAIVPFL